MYFDVIRNKFPNSPSTGMYVAPDLPAVKLGKILSSETRVKQPTEVAAFYLEEGMFSKFYVILTATRCVWPGGTVELADITNAQADGKIITISANRLGSISQFSLRIKDENNAKTLARVLSDIAIFDTEKTEEKPDYSKFEGSALDWLLLRDEVMKTIDQLYEKFNDGKLSLLEYEEKKAELLKRL